MKRYQLRRFRYYPGRLNRRAGKKTAGKSGWLSLASYLTFVFVFYVVMRVAGGVFFSSAAVAVPDINPINFFNHLNPVHSGDQNELNGELPGSDNLPETDTGVIRGSILLQYYLFNNAITTREDANGFPEGGETKKAYLTFDDGPGKYTPRLLEILDELEVKATFFVNGDESSFSKVMYRAIFNKGHALGNHTYSHDYKNIYASPENFLQDLKKLEKLLFSTTAQKPKIMRFPGGTSNTVSRSVSGYDIMAELTDLVTEQGYIYYDWNCYGFDGNYPPPPAGSIAASVLGQAEDKNPLIILLHDNDHSENTMQALPQIVSGLKEIGYDFHVLSPAVERVQFR